MPIHNFNTDQEFISIDKLPDFRSDTEREFTPLSVFNHNLSDLAYAERLAEESINISGAWITIFPRTDNAGTSNEVWDEDPDPTYKNGKKFKGYFVPDPIGIELTKWGIDVQNKTAVVFARAVLFKAFGARMLRPGDVLRVPHNTLSPVQIAETGGIKNRMDTFRIINAADIGNFRYRWLYYRCNVELITGDITIQIEHE